MNERENRPPPRRAIESARSGIRLSRAMRLISLDNNPLRRRSDRIESLVLLTALALGLVAVPVAGAASSSFRWSASETAAHQRATTRPVTAHTLQDAPPVAADATGLVLRRVPATWLDEHRIEHQTTVAVAPHTEAGDEVEIWVDESGSVVPRPRTSSEIAGLALLVGLKVLLGWWAALAVVMYGVRRLLGLLRLRGWQTEWQRVEANWNGRGR